MIIYTALQSTLSSCDTSSTRANLDWSCWSLMYQSPMHLWGSGGGRVVVVVGGLWWWWEGCGGGGRLWWWWEGCGGGGRIVVVVVERMILVQ